MFTEDRGNGVEPGPSLVGELITIEQDAQIAHALGSGEATVVLTFRVPAGLAQAVQALLTMLDEADENCRQGDYLLTLATPPGVVAYRRWLLTQFADQAAGAAPPRPDPTR